MTQKPPPEFPQIPRAPRSLPRWQEFSEQQGVIATTVRGLCEFLNSNNVPCDAHHIEAFFCMAVAHAKKLGQGRAGVHKLVETVYGPSNRIIVPMVPRPRKPNGGRG